MKTFSFFLHCVSISDVIIVDINALVSGSVQLLHFATSPWSGMWVAKVGAIKFKCNEAQ